MQKLHVFFTVPPQMWPSGESRDHEEVNTGRNTWVPA